MFVLACATTLDASRAAAQASGAEARIRQAREERDLIRRERDSLDARLKELQGTSRNQSEEAKILERQHELTSRALNALSRELREATDDVDGASGSLVRAQDELIIKKATLSRRLVDIYKRGPLYTFEALLSAQSFGELVSRYKYLRIIALRDRALVRRTEQLRDTVSGKRQELVVLQNALVLDRQEKAEEEIRLGSLERQMEQKLAVTQRSAQATANRLRAVEASVKRLDDMIATAVAENRRADARPAAAAAPPARNSLRPADRNTYEWPVDGDIMYSFGRQQNANNTTTKSDGVGIAAALGAPVKAIAEGKVRVAEQLGTYGLSVVLVAPDGTFFIYNSLSAILVGVGQTVEKGEPVGRVGVSDPELGPHLHFQIRDKDGRAIDPVEWLRRRQ